MPTSLRIGDNTIEGKQQVADALNTHFINIAETIKRSEFEAENINYLKDYIDLKLQNIAFDIDFITPFEVSALIDKLNINKACGLDRIGPNVLKICKDQLAQPLAALINSCISSGTCQRNPAL